MGPGATSKGAELDRAAWKWATIPRMYFASKKEGKQSTWSPPKRPSSRGKKTGSRGSRGGSTTFGARCRSQTLNIHVFLDKEIPNRGCTEKEGNPLAKPAARGASVPDTLPLRVCMTHDGKLKTVMNYVCCDSRANAHIIDHGKKG